MKSAAVWLRALMLSDCIHLATHFLTHYNSILFCEWICGLRSVQFWM